MMQAQYLPVESDDANRQQQAARAFYLFGDFMRGIDTVRRMEPGNVSDSGLLGPTQPRFDVGVGQGGEMFVRGQAGQVAATQQAPQDSARGGFMGMNSTTLMMLAAGAAVLWLVLRK